MIQFPTETDRYGNGTKRPPNEYLLIIIILEKTVLVLLTLHL